MTLGGQFVQYTQIAEMIREQWKKIGIDLRCRRSSAASPSSAPRQRAAARRVEQRRQRAPLHLPAPRVPLRASPTSPSGPLYAKWFRSGGTQGKEPEPRMKELMEKWKKAFGVPEKERIQLGKDVWRIAPRRSTSSAWSARARRPWACAW
jgi:ABC-type transport system substrate-binding protein